MRPGQAERRGHDYIRRGAIGLFAALDVKTGTVIGARKGRRALTFRALNASVSNRPTQPARSIFPLRGIGSQLACVACSTADRVRPGSRPGQALPEH
jgi:hypothetical protein